MASVRIPTFNETVSVYESFESKIGETSCEGMHDEECNNNNIIKRGNETKSCNRSGNVQ